MNLSEHHSLDFTLTALCIWREARGEPLDAKKGVAWVIRNRTLRPGWWGTDWTTVVLQPYQFSSFNRDDPNAVKWPAKSDLSWSECLTAAREAWEALNPDPTNGSTHYYDDSIKAPAWTSKMTATVKIGKLNFFKS